jgi:hypothetical protein
MSEHNATPWRYTADNNTSYGRVVIEASDGWTIAWVIDDITSVDPEANAAFIVRAVNAYDDLVAALRPFAELADIFASTGASTIGGPDMGKALAAARAALTKAQQQ